MKNILKKSIKETYQLGLKKPGIYFLGFLFFFALSLYLFLITAIMQHFFDFPFNWDSYSINYIVGKGWLHISLLFLMVFLNTIIFCFIGAFFTLVFFHSIKKDGLAEDINSYLKWKKLAKFISEGYIKMLLLFIPFTLVFLIVTLMLSLPSVLLWGVLAQSTQVNQLVILFIVGLLDSLILSGIFLKIGFSFPILVYEKREVIESLKRSERLTKGFFIEIWTTITFFMFIVFVSNFLVSYVGMLLGYMTLLQFLFNSILVVPLGFILTTRIYLNLKEFAYHKNAPQVR
ncbi:MAG: hypothetical protein B6U72_04025 [Candidatus Altiarchaeales archaeon ex4484_2]|nr:MAG: hypothetical protein B6U72_04025 [Candidatus Altiarchaeales archaeon ex4484_2]